MDLTSRDGDWFLDELCSMSSNVIHFIDTLKTNTLVQELLHFTSLHRALMATHNVYIALQVNYHLLLTSHLRILIFVIHVDLLNCSLIKKKEIFYIYDHQSGDQYTPK